MHSSHLVSDLEQVCDYLVVLVASRVRLAGDVRELLAAHHLLTAPRLDAAALPAGLDVISAATPTGGPPCWSAPTPWRRPGLDGRPGSAWKTSSWAT